MSIKRATWCYRETPWEERFVFCWGKNLHTPVRTLFLALSLSHILSIGRSICHSIILSFYMLFHVSFMYLSVVLVIYHSSLSFSLSLSLSRSLSLSLSYSVYWSLYLSFYHSLILYVVSCLFHVSLCCSSNLSFLSVSLSLSKMEYEFSKINDILIFKRKWCINANFIFVNDNDDELVLNWYCWGLRSQHWI